MVKKKVRKGLETPLTIRGLPKRYFWRFLPLAALGGAILLVVTMTTITDDHKPWRHMGYTAAIVFTLLIAFYVLFHFLGEREKSPRRLQKKETIVSNRNLRDYL